MVKMSIESLIFWNPNSICDFFSPAYRRHRTKYWKYSLAVSRSLPMFSLKYSLKIWALAFELSLSFCCISYCYARPSF